MSPHELIPYLSGLVESDIRLSAMIWGPLGIDKSSIVAQVGIEVISEELLVQIIS